MPTYEYICEACGQKHEAFQKISDKPLVECPHCKASALKRGFGGGFGVSFQGSGFYSTDYQKGAPIKPQEDKKTPPAQETKGCCACGPKHSCK